MEWDGGPRGVSQDHLGFLFSSASDMLHVNALWILRKYYVICIPRRKSSTMPSPHWKTYTVRLTAPPSCSRNQNAGAENT